MTPKRKGCVTALVVAAIAAMMVLVLVGTAMWFVGRRVTPALGKVGEAVTTEDGVDPADPGAGPGVRVLEIGSSIQLSGVEATVLSVEPIGDRVAVRISLSNVVGRDRPYSRRQFAIQDPARVLSRPEVPEGTDPSTPMTLAADQTVTETLTFATGAEPGPYFVIWRPSGLSVDRGIWPFTR